MFLSIAIWILVSALGDPQEFFRRTRNTVGFIAAPALLMAFGAQAAQALVDLVCGRNSFPIFHRLGWWVDRRGLGLVAVYVAVLVAVTMLVDG